MIDTVVQFFKRVGHIHAKFERGMVVAALGSITLFSFLQIVLRVFFDSSLVWADALIRLLLLWLCMGGAMLASQGDRHIRIDVVLQLLPTAFRKYVRVAMSIFTFLVAAVIAWASFRFVAMEREFLSTVLQDIPSWPFQTIIPYSFAVISCRYLVHALSACNWSGKGATE